jgi:hypothetical protein
MNEPHPEPNREITVDGPIGRGFLVLLLVLVGLLEFMAAGSKFLIGAVRGDLEAWRSSTALLTLFGLCYFTLAHGVWSLRSWVPLLSVLLTLLVMAFGLARMIVDDRLDLALAALFMLAMFANLGVLGWAWLPVTRQRLAGAEADD